MSGPHTVVERLVVLIGGLEASVRGAASVEWLEAHRPLHLPWSRVGARRAWLQQPVHTETVSTSILYGNKKHAL